MTNKRILTVGSLTSDLFVRAADYLKMEQSGRPCIGFHLGDKLRIVQKNDAFGGGGANVAVGLARFGGIDVSVMGRIGDDFISEKILKNLNKEGVGAKRVQQGVGEDSGFSVVISCDSGERTVLFAPGANDNFLDFDTEMLEGYDGICLQHLSGSSKTVFNKIREFMVTHPQKFLSWNPGYESLKQGLNEFADLLKRVNVLLINREEAEVFTGKKELNEMFTSFFENGCQGNIIITDGMKGATGCDGTHLYQCPVLDNHERIDTLGAGDSFLSGTAAALITGKSLPDALKLATINAAFVVEKFGAQTGLQSEDELTKHISEIEIETKPFSVAT
jgi:ribokinase